VDPENVLIYIVKNFRFCPLLGVEGHIARVKKSPEIPTIFIQSQYRKVKLVCVFKKIGMQKNQKKLAIG